MTPPLVIRRYDLNDRDIQQTITHYVFYYADKSSSSEKSTPQFTAGFCCYNINFYFEIMIQNIMKKKLQSFRTNYRLSGGTFKTFKIRKNNFK